MSSLAREITLRQLEMFSMVAKQGSFRGAAQTLILSPSAVSQQMQVLERAVGTSLFDRERGKGIRLTESGNVLLGVCEQVFQRLDQGIAELSHIERSKRRRVAFGATRAFASYLLPFLYASFQSREPGVMVHSEVSGQSERIEGVLRGQLDLIVLTEPNAEPHLSLVPLAAQDSILIGLPDHPFTTQGLTPFSALATERLILPIPAVSSGPVQRLGRLTGLAALAAEKLTEPNVTWEVGTVEAQLNAVNSGLGIALVPYCAVAAALSDGVFAALAVEGFPIRSHWYLAWAEGRLSPAAQAFREHLLEQRARIEALSLCPEGSRTGY